MAVLAIDQGTSATKAIVVGDDGSVIGLAECEVWVDATAGGAVDLAPAAARAESSDPHPLRRTARPRPLVSPVGVSVKSHLVGADKGAWASSTT